MWTCIQLFLMCHYILLETSEIESDFIVQKVIRSNYSIMYMIDSECCHMTGIRIGLHSNFQSEVFDGVNEFISFR